MAAFSPYPLAAGSRARFILVSQGSIPWAANRWRLKEKRGQMTWEQLWQVVAGLAVVIIIAKLIES